MQDVSTILRDRQCAIRRELDRRNISLKVVSYDSKIPYSTLLSYFPADSDRQPALMPITALYCLRGHVDADLLNLLNPDGWVTVQTSSGIDFDEIDAACRDFCDRKAAAHHPESEAGRDLGPNEQADLAANVVRLRA